MPIGHMHIGKHVNRWLLVTSLFVVFRTEAKQYAFNYRTTRENTCLS